MKVKIPAPPNFMNPWDFWSWVRPYRLQEWLIKITPRLPFQVVNGFREKLYKETINIDSWDVNNMDFNLAKIILPMLRNLRALRATISFEHNDPIYGHPVQGELFPGALFIDEYQFQYTEIIDSMIFSFNAIVEHDSGAYTEPYWVPDPTRPGRYDIDQYEYYKYTDKVEEGLMNFGKHYRSLWW